MCNSADICFSQFWMLMCRPLHTVFAEQRPLGPNLCICEWISAIMCNLLEILLSQIWIFGLWTPAHCFPGAEIYRAKSVYMRLVLCYMCNSADICFSQFWMQTTARCFCGAEAFRAKSLYMWVDICYMFNLAEISFSQIWMFVCTPLLTVFLEQRSLGPNLCICE